MDRLLFSQCFAGRDELAVQAQSALVCPIDPVGSLEFRVTGPLAEIVHRVPVDGRYLDGAADPSGPAINILLHVVGGKLHELEVYKDDGSQIIVGPYEVDPNLIEVLPLIALRPTRSRT